MVSGTAWLYTNCPWRRQAISRAWLRILRWWETVAGVTPRIETISPQFMWSVAEMASKILSRVWSARALDIFSTSERFIVDLECSEMDGFAAIEQNGHGREFHKTASVYFDIHLNV